MLYTLAFRSIRTLAVFAADLLFGIDRILLTGFQDASRSKLPNEK